MHAGRRRRGVERRDDRVAQVARGRRRCAGCRSRANGSVRPLRDRVDEPRDVAARARADRPAAAAASTGIVGVPRHASASIASASRLLRAYASRGSGASSGMERPAGRRRLAVDLDAAREHEARHAGARPRRARRARSPRRWPRGTPRRRRARSSACDARGEMHDRVRRRASASASASGARARGRRARSRPARLVRTIGRTVARPPRAAARTARRPTKPAAPVTTTGPRQNHFQPCLR